MFQIILLFSIFYTKYVNAIEKNGIIDEDLTLDLVQVIFRHGERSPLQAEAQSINITDWSIYQADFGQLTKKGMRQAYELGQMLRKNYDEHLGKYKEKDVIANTTIASRTKMSLELVLAGLYPPTTDEVWNPNLNWRPIPYTASTDEVDVILAPQFSSSSMNLYYKVMNASDEYQKEISKYKEFYESLEEWTGQKYFDHILFKTCQIHNVLNIHKKSNIKLPTWCTNEIFETIVKLFIFLSKTMSFTQEIQKYNGGSIIRHVIENIENNKHKAKKIYLFSTHDVALSGFTYAQKLINGFSIIPFGSAYILESYTDLQKQYYIKILKWDGSSDHFDEVNITNCEKYCAIEKYKNLVENIIPTDEELNKFFKFPNYVSPSTCSNFNVVNIVLGTIFITVLALIFAIILYVKM